MQKRIAIYCGSKIGKNEKYKEEAKKLGEWMGKNSHTLVYGGSDVGIMGVVANSVMENGGYAIGVFPKNLLSRESPHFNLNEMYEVENIDERKEKMLSLAQVYVALPGGPGTLEEISQAISLKRVEQLDGKCIFFNIAGFYDETKKLFDKMYEEEFITKEERDIVIFVDSLEALIKEIEN